MSALLCCRPRAPSPPCERVMGAALSQEGSACDAAGAPAAPPTMADVIRERKKNAGGAALGTLRRRIAAAARRPRDQRPDRGCEHARYIRSVVSPWRLAEVFLLRAELEAGAALRDLCTQAELARPPAPALNQALCSASRWLCDVELAGCGWTLPAHRALLAARCTHLRLTLPRYPSFSRVPLSGYLAECGREAMAAALRSVYAGTDTASKLCANCSKWERGVGSDTDLDVLSTENTSNTWAGSDSRRCRCGRAVPDPAVLRRLQQGLGFTPDVPATLNHLRASGEYSDCRLSFPRAGPGADLPAHKFILGARSRLFRKVLSGGGACSAAGVISIDEGVLPRRFAKALLHAAYTDQVDLNLIGRGSTSSPSTNSSADGNSSWPGRGGSNSRSSSTTQLEDAFQLYEIARFCEMPILAQGCEDAIAALLSPATLPAILQWSQASHASQWVHRQAMRYLLDEFPACLASPAAAALPAAPLATALQHPHLQCSELQALRAVLRWGAKLKRQQEPNVVWHTTHSVSRLGLGGGAAGARAGAAALREAVAPLVSRVRLEHIPPGNELLQQAIRRGIVCQPPSLVQPGCSADAWLARGPHRPPRCFLPYLDEIKALLEGQAVPEAELARVRRTRYMHRIPDTLYMVAAERPAPPPAPVVPADSLAVPPPTLRALRRRARELRHAPAAATALQATARAQGQLHNVYRQVALRAVREMALPDECAELLLTDLDEQEQTDRDSSWEECDETAARDSIPDRRPDCCRSGSAAAGSQGSLRCASVNSDQPSMSDKERSSLCRRRELPALVAEGQPHRTDSLSRCCVSAAAAPRAACVPDVACTRTAPNGNTHLLPDRDYRALNTHTNFSGLGVLQLDLGDGATHTPRPGSRALRAATQSARQHREPQQMSSVRRPPSDDDELRAAIEMSVIRAYSSSSYGGRARAASPPPAPRPRLAQPHHTHTYSARSSRLTPSPVSLTASSSAHLSLRGESSRESAGTPSPRRHHYRLEPSSYGGSSHSSRGPSPNDYA